MLGDLVKRAECIVAERNELLESGSEHVQRVVALKSKVKAAETNLQEHIVREATEKEQRMEHLCGMIARRMLKRDVARGFGAWIDAWETAVRNKRLLGNAAGMMANPELAGFWRKWKSIWEGLRDAIERRDQENAEMARQLRESRLQTENRQLSEKVQWIEPALEHAQRELEMRTTDLHNAKRRLESSLKEASLEFDRLKESTRHERAALVKSSLRALQQLKEHLTAGLEDLTPKPERPVPIAKSRAKKHRWGIVPTPPDAEGDFDAAFFTQVGAPIGAEPMSQLAPPTRTFTSVRSVPEIKQTHEPKSQHRRCAPACGGSYSPRRDMAVPRSAFPHDPTAVSSTLTKSATSSGSLPTRNSTVAFITPAPPRRAGAAFPEGPATDGGGLANFIRNAEERKRAASQGGKLPSLSAAKPSAYTSN